jgi:hypothetical protein
MAVVDIDQRTARFVQGGGLSPQIIPISESVWQQDFATENQISMFEFKR